MLRQAVTFLIILVIIGDIHAQIPVMELPEASTFKIYLAEDFQSKEKQVSYASIDARSMNSFHQLSQRDQYTEIKRQVENHQLIASANKKRVEEALNVLNAETSPAINYTLRGSNIAGRELFEKALEEYNSMLEGRSPLSVKKAVFISEYAYDPSLSWESFNSKIDKMVQHLGAVMKEEDISPNDHIAKNMMLLRFFTDTLTVKYSELERPITSYPMFYDFEDFWGKEDTNKLFVSKLLQSGTGQCHSLPLLYLILAEEIGAESSLAFSPSHSYIKFKDQIGNWYNIELTNHTLTSDQFIMYSGFVKSEAIANQIYMNPLTKKEVVAQCLTDLASAYTKKYGYEDFVLKCTFLAHQHGLKSMSIHKHNFNYYLTLHNYILEQYKKNGLTAADFKADEKAMNIYNQVAGAKKHIDIMGYADMPPDQYEKWLNSVKSEGQKQEHRNRMRSLMSQME